MPRTIVAGALATSRVSSQPALSQPSAPPPPPPAGAPSAPVLSPYLVGGTNASVYWTTPANNGAPITSYLVYRDGVNIDSVLVGTNAYNDTGLAPGSTHNYQVRASNANGTGGFSNTVSQTLLAVPNAPALSGVAGDAIDGLSFTTPADNGSTITKYNIYRRIGGGALTLYDTIDLVPYYPLAKWLWTPIPASPVVDANSAAMVTALTAGATVSSQVVTAYEYGLPLFYADASTPLATVHVLNEVAYATRCDLSGPGAPGAAATRLIPLDPTWQASLGTDGKMTIIDAVAGLIYDLQATTHSGGVWGCDWGGVYPLSGDASNHGSITSRPTGSGMSQLAGMITIKEMREALWPGIPIPHALIFASDKNAASATNTSDPTKARAPASMSDGNAHGPVPEGARFQYTGAIDPAWPLYAQIVAQAAKTYGMVDGDNGGPGVQFSIGRENFKSGDSGTDPWYGAAGGSNWYLPLNMIPWSSSRVLAKWDGT